jgi:hypothetical protein
MELRRALQLDRSLRAAAVDEDDAGRAWRSCGFRLEEFVALEEELLAFRDMIRSWSRDWNWS